MHFHPIGGPQAHVNSESGQCMERRYAPWSREFSLRTGKICATANAVRLRQGVRNSPDQPGREPDIGLSDLLCEERDYGPSSLEVLTAKQCTNCL
jgi:hypothetical protein